MYSVVFILYQRKLEFRVFNDFFKVIKLVNGRGIDKFIFFDSGLLVYSMMLGYY